MSEDADSRLARAQKLYRAQQIFANKSTPTPVEKPTWDGSWDGLGASIDQAKRYKDQQDGAPEGSQDKPIQSDIFGSDADRTKSSFGDTQGIGKMLVQKGFVDFAKNKDGELVAKDKDGKWHKDANGFLSNPINWAESSAGKALPTAGGIAGGILASPTGPGAIGAAAAGGAGGEAARIGIGKGLGVYDGGLGDAAMDVGKEGAIMGLGEGVGRGVVDPAIKAFGPEIDATARSAGNSIKNGVQGASDFVDKIVPDPVKHIASYALGADSMHGGFSPTKMVAAAMINPEARNRAISGASGSVESIANSPWVQSLAKNPHLIQSISNPALRDTVSQAIASAGGGSGHDEPHYDPKDQKMVSQDVSKQQFLDGN